MFTHLLISIISDDKPGVVEALAETISQESGNWLESRLTKLSGKFAGVIRVSVKKDHVDQLESKCQQLQEKGIWTKIDHIDSDNATAEGKRTAHIHALGPDRSGIVRELSRALVSQNINVANLETRLSSMPYSGDPLFEATGELEIPENADLDSLNDTLDRIADSLALDISMSDKAFDT